jgi:hypothetical protein
VADFGAVVNCSRTDATDPTRHVIGPPPSKARLAVRLGVIAMQVWMSVGDWRQVSEVRMATELGQFGLLGSIGEVCAAENREMT